MLRQVVVGYTVILDTGSTDLWVNTLDRHPTLTNSTDLEVQIQYGQGGVTGSISFAELQLGDFVIPSQGVFSLPHHKSLCLSVLYIAFINPSKISDMDLSGYDGIMGMAFDVASIYETVQQAWGTDAADRLARAPITSLFALNPSLPNNFDVQLARTDALDDPAEGAFVISGHADGFSAVASAPRLPRVSDQHWSIVMDGMRVDGQAFAFSASRISGTPAGKVVAALDTGFSFPPLPAAAVDAIYGSIEGAVYNSDYGTYFVPCTSGTNLTFTFASVAVFHSFLYGRY